MIGNSRRIRLPTCWRARRWWSTSCWKWISRSMLESAGRCRGRGRHNRRLLHSSTGAPQRWGWQSESQPRSSPAAAESPRRECWRGGLQAQPIGLEWRIRVDQGERFADGLSDQQSIERIASQLGVTNFIHSTSGESKRVASTRTSGSASEIAMRSPCRLAAAARAPLSKNRSFCQLQRRS